MKLQLSDGTNLTLDDSLTDDEAMQLWYFAEDQLKSELADKEQPVEAPVAQTPAQPVAETPESETGDFSRGFQIAYKQLPQLGYGLEAGALAAGESILGEGGKLTELKKEAVAKYEEAGNEIQATSKPTDSPTYSFEKAMEGDYGSLVDTLQYGLGYGAGQISQGGVASFAGKFVGKAVARATAENIAEKMVAEETAKWEAKVATGILTEEQLKSLGTQTVAKKMGDIGSKVALGSQAFGMEAGEIGGDLANQSVDENRTLTTGEVVKGLISAIAATALEYGADRFTLGALMGRGSLSDVGQYTTGIKGKLVRGAALGSSAGGVEFGTEFLQTGIEQYGEGKDILSNDSLREDIDSAILGGIGGHAVGVTGGMLSSAKQKPNTVNPEGTPIAESMLQGGLPTATAQPVDTNLDDYNNIFSDENLNRRSNAPIVDNETIAADIISSDDPIATFNDVVEANTFGHDVTHAQAQDEANNPIVEPVVEQPVAIAKPVKSKSDKLPATQESLSLIEQAVAQGGVELKGEMLYLPTGEKYSLNKAQREHYANLVTPIVADDTPVATTEETPFTPTHELDAGSTPVQLKQDSDGNDFYIDADGSEYDTNEPAEPIKTTVAPVTPLSQTSDTPLVDDAGKQENSVLSELSLPPGGKKYIWHGSQTNDDGEKEPVRFLVQKQGNGTFSIIREITYQDGEKYISHLNLDGLWDTGVPAVASVSVSTNKGQIDGALRKGADTFLTIDYATKWLNAVVEKYGYEKNEPTNRNNAVVNSSTDSDNANVSSNDSSNNNVQGLNNEPNAPVTTSDVGVTPLPQTSDTPASDTNLNVPLDSAQQTPELKKDGTPFAKVSAANLIINSKNRTDLSNETHEAVALPGGGFGIVAKAPTTTTEKSVENSADNLASSFPVEKNKSGWRKAFNDANDDFMRQHDILRAIAEIQSTSDSELFDIAQKRSSLPISGSHVYKAILSNKNASDKTKSYVDKLIADQEKRISEPFGKEENQQPTAQTSSDNVEVSRGTVEQPVENQPESTSAFSTYNAIANEYRMSVNEKGEILNEDGKSTGVVLTIRKGGVNVIGSSGEKLAQYPSDKFGNLFEKYWHRNKTSSPEYTKWQREEEYKKSVRDALARQPVEKPAENKQVDDNVSKKDGEIDRAAQSEKESTPEMQAAKDKVASELDDIDSQLDDVLGEIGMGIMQRLSMKVMPEQQNSIAPLIAKAMILLGKKGYIQFKDSAVEVIKLVRGKFGDKIADAIDIEDLQGGYIGARKYIEGADDYAKVGEFKEITDLFVEDSVESEPTVNTENNKTDSNVGDTVTISTPSNEKQFDAQYEVAEIGDVTASHDMNNRTNEAFNDDKLQGRDRTDIDYEVKTQDQIKNFNPKFLGASVASDDGAPIITNSTSKVISGNGRHILLSRLYSRFPDKAAQYKQWLIDNAKQFGLSPDVIAKMDKPILVRRKSNDDDLELIADKSNVSGMAEMSALDRAFSDARQVSESVFLQFKGGELESFANQSFVQAFNDALNLGGSLTLTSLNRMKNAIMAHAYGDYGSAKGRAIVEGVSEELKPDAKSILNALYNSSSEWVLLRATFVATGTKDFTNHLVDAVHLIRDARANGKEVKDMVDQYDIETMSSTDPFTRQFVQLFFKDTNMKTMIAEKDIAAILKDVATEMSKQISNRDMFDDAKPLTPKQILENAYARYKGTKSQPKGQVGLFDAGTGLESFSPYAKRGDKQREAESRKAESGQGTDSTGVKNAGREVTPTYTNKSQARKHLQQVLKAKTEELVKSGELEIENNWAQATFSSNKELREFMFDEALKVEDSGFGFSTTRFGRNLAADSMRDMVFNDVFGFRAKGAVEYVNHLKTLVPIEGNTNVPSTNTDLERNNGVTNSANERNETPVFDGSTGNDDLLGQTSEPVKSTENVANSDKLDSISIALTGGASSDNQLLDGNETNVIASSDARDSDSGRSGEDSLNGMDAKRDGSNPIKELPAKSVKGLKPKQVTHVEADLENVKEAMPFLNEGQADDVVFAEKRFEEHKGVLFANGTGTGKTFSGLGIVSRFANQGKNNILIVAPSQNILDSWTKAAKNFFGLDVSLLEDKNDAGKGIVATTYANFGDNVALVNREWDLIVTDEAHYLMSNSAGTNTASLEKLRGLTGHESGFSAWFNAKHSDLRDKINEQKQLKESKSNDYDEVLHDKLDKELHDYAASEREEWKNNESKTKTVMLSATPFAYESNIDFANGYLFNYDKVDGSGYNAGGGKERFFMQHLGYRMRHNKLTQPDAKVDRSTMQRQLNEMLKKTGALSARSLDVPFDYDRQFILTESAIGQRIDEALQWLSDTKSDELARYINKKFDGLTRKYVLEAIKAKEIIPVIKEHLAAGRKVLAFHDYKKGGAKNPFIYTGDTTRNQEVVPSMDGSRTFKRDALNDPHNRLLDEYERFKAQFPDLISNDLLSKMDSPIELFQQEFGKDALIYNGDVSSKERIARVAQFNDDNSGKNLILLQSASAKEGVSFHDTTGVHQRVLINIGLPTAPTTAIQQEGRIYRVGQKSDAIFRYVNTGTNWERWAFASTIAGRASAAENLALGEGARGLRDAFINAFENSDSYPVGHEGEGKGSKDSDKQAYRQITEMDRAKGFYYATQKKNSRTKSAEGTDYFATPEPVGLVMTRLADAREGEKMLEPSAGHGAIARWFRTDAERTAIEPSSELNSRLALVFQDGDIKRQTFEDLNIVNKYDAIVMNPPFGTGGKTAIEHLEKAFNHLRDGGRVVALIPEGAMADKRLDAWLNGETEIKAATQAGEIKPIYHSEKFGDIYNGDTVVIKGFGTDKEYIVESIYKSGGTFLKMKGVAKESAINIFALKDVKPTGNRFAEASSAKTKQSNPDAKLVYDISLPTVTFERAGTKVKTHIVVIEKTSSNITTENVDLSGIDDINQLFDRLDALSIDERVKPVEEVAEKESTPVASNATETVGTLVEGKHTKTGEAIFTVQLPARVERDTYTKWAAAAKQMGGGWSRFTNGFLFKSKDAADKFMDYLSGGSEIKYSYAGQRAQNADNSALAKAVQMEQEGVDNETIRKETGWFLGMDDKWRFEVDDSVAKYKQDFKAIPEKTKFTVGEVLDNPELYKQYPDAADIKFEIRSPFFDWSQSTNGWYDKGNNEIVVTPYAKDPRSTIIHEIQHWIQDKEGFASGGHSDSVTNYDENLLNTLEKYILSDVSTNKIMKDWVQKDISKVRKSLSEINVLHKSLVKLEGINAKIDNIKKIIDGRMKSIETKTRSEYADKYQFTKDAIDKNRIAVTALQDKRFNAPSEVIKEFINSKIRALDDEANRLHYESMTYLNPSRAIRELNTKYNEPLDKLRELKYSTEKDIRERSSELYALVPSTVKHRVYKLISGEIEARDVEARKDFTPEQRKDSTPYTSQGISKEDAIVRFDEGVANSETTPDTHSKQSFMSKAKSALDAKFGKGWFDRLWGTGSFEAVSDAEAKAIVSGGSKFHKVWHGSPHDFDKFSSDNIGTGEGAQAFGYGLYFAGAKDVAEWYRDKLSEDKSKIDGIKLSEITEIDGLNDTAKNYFLANNLSLKNAISEVEKELEKQEGSPRGVSKDFSTALQQLKSFDENRIDKEKGGKLFEVELAPSQDEYLLWDKPLSEQSDKVRDLLNGKIPEHRIDRFLQLRVGDLMIPSSGESELTGRDIYLLFKMQGDNAKLASNALNKLGIKGIKYKGDGGGGGYNYVIFDDNDITIEAKYSKDGKIEAFYNPADDKVYFVPENISKDTDLAYLFAHEIGVHMMQMGENQAGFDAILREVETLVKTGNEHAVKGRKDAENAGTKAQHLTEETLAYMIKHAPKLSIVQKFFAWFRKGLRAWGLTRFKGEAKTRWLSWETKLTSDDVSYMAYAALKRAPSEVVFKGTGSRGDENKASKVLSAKQILELNNAGQMDLLAFMESTSNAPRKNSRIGMHFKDVLKRTPELTRAAQQLINGEITAKEYDKLVEKFKPVEPYTSIPNPATTAEMQEALSANKIALINEPSRTLPNGYSVRLRLDIPAYTRSGVWVVTAHEDNSKQKVIGYESTAIANDVSFIVDEKGALKIAAQERDKYPLATVSGKWENATPESAFVEAKAALNNKNWVQVGMDPERHSYFYDRGSMKPVTGGDRVIQVGSLLMVRNPVFGNKDDFLFSTDSDSDKKPLLAPNGKPSNLNAMQHAQVRTKEFLNWFGDWINDPQNASKVVDENGEPLVVYHGTNKTENDFYEFSHDKYRSGSGQNEGGKMFFFTPSFDDARGYSFLAARNNGLEYDQEKGWQEDKYERVIGAFVNVRNPIEVESIDDQVSSQFNRTKGNDGMIRYRWVAIDDDYENFNDDNWKKEISELGVDNANQIKSAIGNTGAFDSSNNDIRFSKSQDRRISESERLNVSSEIKKLIDKFEKGEITQDKLLQTLAVLHGKLESNKDDKAILSAQKQRVRGADFIRQRLLEAKRRGDITSETADIAEWFVLKNEALFDDLGISIKASDASQSENANAVGYYDAMRRIITLIKGSANDTTAVHEMLHHLEKMMPDNLQNDIRKEWMRHVLEARKKATDTQEIKYLEAVIAGDQSRAMDILKGIPDNNQTLYRLLNSSEFWAVNGSDALMARFKSKGGFMLRVANWLKEFSNHVKSAFGFATNSPVIKTLDDLLKNTNPISPNGRSMLSDEGVLFADVSKSNNKSQGRFNIPNETSFQFFRKWVQDDLLRIRIVMDRVKEQGGIINESNDVALAMEAAGNIAANQLEKLKERYIQPLFDRMAKMKVNQDEIGLLLYAKSAPDRNAYIQSINPKFRKLGEGGSGMTDKESAAIIERYKETMGDKYAEFEKLTDDWQNIQNIVKNILVASGDISPEQAQEWDNSTDYHVPLKGFEEIDEETGNKAKKSSRGNIGQGFSISGKFDIKMVGRQSRASNIVANIVQNLERAVIRSSKIYVQSTLYNLIKDNPDVDLWKADVTPMRPIMGKAKAQYVMTFHGSVIGQRDTLRDARRYVEAETERTGQSKKEYKIVKVGGNPQVTLMKKSYDQNTEISYWKNGKQVRITVNDEAFVQAFNRLGDENIYSMFKVMAAFNRFLRQTLTVLSPAFIIANGIMVDPAVGLYTNTARHGFKYAATVLAKTPMASLQIAKYMATGATSNTAWNTAIKLYLDNGGKSGSAFISSIENKADELNSAVLKSKMQNTNFYEYPLDRLKLLVVENKLVNFLKYLGDVSETATRLATFKVAMDDGKSAQQAAKIARNVTINFNRRGIAGRELGAMYLFLNASIQGTENLIDAAVRGEHKVQSTALLATYVSIGYLIALLGGDDGDDDLISESEKTRFISVTLDEEKGIRANWKMAYGLSFFKDLGTAIARIQLGGDTEKIMGKLMSSFFNNFSYVNPMVSGEWDNRDLISGAIPTITNIPYSIFNNRNRWGKPIYPENVYDTSIPDSEKEWANTRGTLFSDFAKWMSKVTGGTKVEAGLIDVSPESMKYTLNALTGAIGTQSYKLVNSIYTSSINSTEMSVDKLPIVSSFIKETGIDAYRQVYNSQRKEAKEIYDKFKKYEKLDDEAATDKFVARHQSMLDFYDDTTSIIRRVKLLRTKQDDARLEGDRVLLKELESDEKELLIDYNAQYNQR